MALAEALRVLHGVQYLQEVPTKLDEDPLTANPTGRTSRSLLKPLKAVLDPVVRTIDVVTVASDFFEYGPIQTIVPRGLRNVVDLAHHRPQRCQYVYELIVLLGGATRIMSATTMSRISCTTAMTSPTVLQDIGNINRDGQRFCSLIRMERKSQRLATYVSGWQLQLLSASDEDEGKEQAARAEKV